MYCGNCGTLIDENSRFCNHCGSAQVVASAPADRETSRDQISGSLQTSPAGTVHIVDPKARRDLAGRKPAKGWLWGLGAAAVLLIIAVGSKPNAGPVENTSAVNETADAAFSSGADKTSTATLVANENTPVSEAAKPSPWTYSSDEDKVRNSTTYFASTTSTNSIHQNSPYDGETTMDLTVRKSVAHGTDVVLTISSGQMMCPSYEGCSGTVSFDGGAPQRISFNGPADNSSDTVFVIGAKSFIDHLKRSKKVVVEKTLYEAGNPQFEFDVSDLVWAH